MNSSDGYPFPPEDPTFSSKFSVVINSIGVLFDLPYQILLVPVNIFPKLRRIIIKIIPQAPNKYLWY